MNAYDFSPLFRSTVGFDRLARLAESALRVDQNAAGYPPYNIEKTGENGYRISIAVAGFTEDELSIEAKGGELTVVGKKAERDDANYLYRGIATRDFFRKFHLADHVRVEGAHLDNGMLNIELVHELPEAMKPRTVTIERGAPGQPSLEAAKTEERAA